jgi:hypothetical protein
LLVLRALQVLIFARKSVSKLISKFASKKFAFLESELCQSRRAIVRTFTCAECIAFDAVQLFNKTISFGCAAFDGSLGFVGAGFLAARRAFKPFASRWSVHSNRALGAFANNLCTRICDGPVAGDVKEVASVAVINLAGEIQTPHVGGKSAVGRCGVLFIWRVANIARGSDEIVIHLLQRGTIIARDATVAKVLWGRSGGGWCWVKWTQVSFAAAFRLTSVLAHIASRTVRRGSVADACFWIVWFQVPVSRAIVWGGNGGCSFGCGGLGSGGGGGDGLGGGGGGGDGRGGGGGGSGRRKRTPTSNELVSQPTSYTLSAFITKCSG